LRLPVWIAAPTDGAHVVRHLQFSYGIEPVFVPEISPEWTAFARQWVHAEGLAGSVALLVQGPSRANPHANHRMEILQLHQP